jgi:predicted nucleotidyltransferase
MVRSARNPGRVNIEPRMAALVQYLASRDEVLAAYLFGSYGTAHQTALSDVDIAVLFYRDRRPAPRGLLALEADVSRLCGEDDVNVLSLNDADITLQFRVLETDRLLLAKEPGAVSDFREYVFRVHGDFEPFYRAFCRDYDQALREAYSRDRPGQGQG